VSYFVDICHSYFYYTDASNFKINRHGIRIMNSNRIST